MKTAIIKQIYDAHGPWSSIKWQDTTPKEIFNIWPSKPTLWGLTCLLKADWYVVPQDKLKSDYVRDILNHPLRRRIMEKYTTNIVAVKDIPFEDYDLVITMDPISEIPKQSKTLFAYYAQDDWDRIYLKSLLRPMGNYDLFLDSVLNLKSELVKLPQSVSFPFLFASEAARSLFQPIKKKETVWADWRLLAALGMIHMWSESAEKAAKRLEDLIRIPVCYKGDFNRAPFGISDPPLWGEAVSYFEAMGQCKYYLAVGRYSGVGNGAYEAASLGSICIGEVDKVYHRMVCHPKCLCSDMLEMPKIFRRVASSLELQKEVLDYQDKALKQKFAEEPIALLEKAVKMKQKIC